jgi:DHA3 family macrolide efflux protein-like MFS transporter
LLRVNAINSTIQSVCMLVAPALAAVLLVAWKDVHWILLLDVITAIIAIAILAPIPIPKPPGAEAERRHIWREMAEGGRAVAASPVLRRTFWLDGAVWTLIMPAAMLAPIVVTKLWGGEEWMLAGVEIAYSGAFILGAAFLAAWGGLRNRMKLMLVGALMWGAFTLAQALSPGVWVYIILWGAFGLVGPWLTTTGVTVLQENCPPDLLGRVMGLNTMVGLLAGPVGMMVIAPFMDLPNPPVRLVLAITGVLAMAATALAAIKAPSAIRPDPAPPPAAPELSPEPS